MTDTPAAQATSPDATATAQSPAAVATVRTIEHVEASALPDPSWGWRRLLIFLITMVCLALAWRISERTTDIVTLRMIARYALWLVGMCLFIYGAFAGAQDIVRLIAAFRTTRRETVTTAAAPGPGQ